MYQIRDSNLLTEVSTIKNVERFSLKGHSGGPLLLCFFVCGLAVDEENITQRYKTYSNPLTGVDSPWGFQEVEAP